VGKKGGKREKTAKGGDQPHWDRGKTNTEETGGFILQIRREARKNQREWSWKKKCGSESVSGETKSEKGRAPAKGGNTKNGRRFGGRKLDHGLGKNKKETEKGEGNPSSQSLGRGWKKKKNCLLGWGKLER